MSTVEQLRKDSLLPHGLKNRLINGEMIVSQRLGITAASSASTPKNSNATYLLDRWCLLSDGNDIVSVWQDLSTIAPGSRASMRSQAVTPDKRWGFLQILESNDTWDISNDGVVSLSFKAMSPAANLSNVRAAVLGWSSTIDAPTRDVVSVWAGANPTLAANWTYLNTPSNLALTASLQTFKIQGIPISAYNNLAVFIWVDDAVITNGDGLLITDVQLESGNNATTIERRPFGLELALCQRYYEGSFRYGIEAVLANVTTADQLVLACAPNGATSISNQVQFKAQKRTAGYTVRALRTEEGKWDWYTALGVIAADAPITSAQQQGFFASTDLDDTRVFVVGAFTIDNEMGV